MRVSKRGQITIPKRLRYQYSMHCGVDIEVIPLRNGILIKKRTTDQHPVDRVYGLLCKQENVDEYVEEIRGR